MTTSALIRCKFLCKSWLRLFSDPNFIKPLFSRTPTSLIVRGGPKMDYYFLGLDKASIPNGDLFKFSGDLFNVDIVGSCNGCLCLYHAGRKGTGDRFYLANPITAESLALPQHHNLFPQWGFGYSPVSNVYKLVLFRTPAEEEGIFSFDGFETDVVMVLTVGSSVWRKVGSYSYPDRGGDGVYFNGFIHWVWKISDWICAFDVEHERFQQLPPPPCSVGGYFSDFRLQVLRGCLCLIVPMDVNVSIWVMKDYGVKESWTKEFDVVNVFGHHFPRILRFTEEEEGGSLGDT